MINIILCPILLAASIFFLFYNYPDSRNVLIFLTVSMIMAILTNIFMRLASKKKFRILSVIFFLVQNMAIIAILSPSFYLIKVPNFVLILLAIFDVAFAGLAIFRFLTKNNEISYFEESSSDGHLGFSLETKIEFFAVFLVVVMLHFFSIVTLFTALKIFPLLFFVATSLLALSAYKKMVAISESSTSLFSDIGFAISQFFMCSACVMMFV